MAPTKKINSAERLPNAPLAEVVFEIRWALQREETMPPPLRVDPGFGVLADSFTDSCSTRVDADRAGFRLANLF